MAVEQVVLDLSFKNSSAASTIAQYSVVHYDVTTAFGAVPPGNANAGPIAGVNQSSGVDPVSGAVTLSSGLLQPVQVGQSMEVRIIGVSRVITTAVQTVLGAPLYVVNASGQVANAKATGDFNGSMVGFGMEANSATLGDLVSCYLTPSLQPALKKLGTVAAPNTANGVANTQSTYAHGLGYIPSIVLLVSAGSLPTGVLGESAAADATNISVKSTVASSTFIAYVV